MTTTTTRGGDRSALAGLRLRRLIPLLRRHRLYRAAHVLKRKTCVVFDAARLRRMMLSDRWAAASAYAISFVDYHDCSHEADEVNYRILVLRVLAALAAGQARSVEPLFRRIYACLRFFPEYDRIRGLLLAMRSDDTKSSRLYGRFKPTAVQGIMDLVAKCPELNKASTRSPPRCMSLGHTASWRSTNHHKNKATNLPAHILAHSFMPKKPPQISHRMNSSDAPSIAGIEGMLSTLRVTVLPGIASSATQAAVTQREGAQITEVPAAASNLVAGLRTPRQRRPNPHYIGSEWIA